LFQTASQVLQCDSCRAASKYVLMRDAKQHTKSAHLDLIDSIIRNPKNYNNTTSAV